MLGLAALLAGYLPALRAASVKTNPVSKERLKTLFISNLRNSVYTDPAWNPKWKRLRSLDS